MTIFSAVNVHDSKTNPHTQCTTC